MKITGKLLKTFILYSILAVSANAETIQFGKKRNTKKENNINAAQIKDNEAGVASTSFSNLPKDEVINTFFADPLSDEFMGENSSELDSERNRSTSDLLSEFEGQAKEINDNTEIPDDSELVDQHSKEDRARIEARADELLKEAAIQESKDNTGESLKETNKENINEKLSSKLDENRGLTNIATYTDLYTEDASESVSIENKTDIKEYQPISNSEISEVEEDPEFSGKNTETNPKEDVVIIEEQLPEEKNTDIPDYEKMDGIVSADNIDKTKESSNKEIKGKDSDKKKKTSKKQKQLKAMSEPLEPVLLTYGKPKSSDDESEKVYTYNGILIPEKQPLSRKKHMLRWVLKLDDGTRIPLKSNLKLLQEVRKESNLADYVSVSGKMRTSALEKDLKYLVPDSIVKGGKPKLEKVSDKNDKNDNKENIENIENKEEKSENTSDEIKEVTTNNDNNEELITSENASIEKDSNQDSAK